MIFFPWYPAFLLACESNHVIDVRLRKMATLTLPEANAEVGLMITEKATAAAQALMILMWGGSAATVIKNYRLAVAANDRRLTGSA